MSEDKAKLEVLARRAIGCKHWRWMGGMQVVHTPRHDGATGFFLRLSQDGYVPAENEYPDLNDPATLGCLASLVRQVTGKPHLFCSYRQEGFWGVADHDEFLSDFYRIEAEAWVEVLEDWNER